MDVQKTSIYCSQIAMLVYSLIHRQWCAGACMIDSLVANCLKALRVAEVSFFFLPGLTLPKQLIPAMPAP
jgi:hypothetical protein